jgi:peroxiredoxin Q/BCP
MGILDDLEVRDARGVPVRFGELFAQGRWVLLWFYPKAKSPGCSAQGRGYARRIEEFKELGVEVFGVSHDSARAQCSFLEQLAWEGRMIPDRQGLLARRLGVRRWLGFHRRDTVLLNPQGAIEQVWRSVNPWRDPEVVLSYLRERCQKS